MSIEYENDNEQEDYGYDDYEYYYDEDQKNENSKINFCDAVKCKDFKGLPKIVKDVIDSKYNQRIMKIAESLKERVKPINEATYCERALYMVRHGQCDLKLKDYPLSDLGRDQSKLLGESFRFQHLTFDRIISSGVLRAFETAKIARNELSFFPGIEIDRDLNECDYKQLCNNLRLQACEYVYRAFDKYTQVPSLFSQEGRKYQSYLCVCHSNIIHHFISCIRGELQQHPVGHTSVTRVTVASNGVVNVDFFNDDTHCPISPENMRTTENLCS